jgi:hypothetical protein
MNATDGGRGLVAGPQSEGWPAHFFTLECDVCSASWIGPDGEPCGWCAKRGARQRDEQRQLLLFPPQLAEPGGGMYDDLDDVAKRIWEHTRGIRRGEGSIQAWRDRLADAITGGLITRDEAVAAVLRIQGSHDA